MSTLVRAQKKGVLMRRSTSTVKEYMSDYAANSLKDCCRASIVN